MSIRITDSNSVKHEAQNLPSGVYWMTPPEFLRMHQGLISKTFLYDSINSGDIPAKRMGRGKLLLRSDALNLLPNAPDTRSGE